MTIFIKYLKAIVAFLLFFTLIGPYQASASETNYGKFTSGLSKELKQYISKNGGDITLQYRDLNTGEEYQRNAGSSRAAASTIKLPLALYVMELAAAKKINLNQKLTYKSYHYYGGSGVIQKDKVGSKYTIRDLVKKAMVYSDNIAFIMLKEKVGRSNFNAYLKRVGGKYAYPNGQNRTSSRDLTIYANRLYDFSQKNDLGKELVKYLKSTIYNTTIPKGIKGVEVAHKVGMIPNNKIYNDVGIVYDKNPFIFAIMTNNLSYEKSQKVIADIASIVYKHHKTKHNVKYIKTKKDVAVYQNTTGKLIKLGTASKSESLKITANQGFWYQVQYGTKKGYIKKKDVSSYLKMSTTGFSNGKLKNNYLLKTGKTAYVRSQASSKGRKIATLYKSNTIYFDSKSGDYYKVAIGERIGYIHKSSVALQFTKAIKYYQPNKDVAVYSNTTGSLNKVGSLKKGEIFSRLKEDGKWHAIEFGSSQGYILQSETAPILEAKLNNPIGDRTQLGEIEIIEDAKVYKSLTEPTTEIASVQKGQKVAFIEKVNEGYAINISGRFGYVNESAVKGHTGVGVVAAAATKASSKPKQISPNFKISTEAARISPNSKVSTEPLEVISVSKASTKPTRITFAGDLMMDWSVKNTINKKGVDYPFKSIKSDVTKSDLAVANLETAITTRTAKQSKEYNFKSNPSSFNGVKNAGFDIVSLANNHTMDYNRSGLTDTMSHLKKYKLAYIGAGYTSKEAYTAKTYTVDGNKIKFLAFSRVLPYTSWVVQSKQAGIANGYDINLIRNTIKKESKNSDYLFVYMHWGVEKSKRPESYQRTWAKQMIDSGADAIVGSHPHVLQGFEYYKGKPIAYSLGNFLFPDYVSGDKAQTGLLHFNLEKGKITMKFTPYHISKDQIKAQSTTTRQKVWKSLESISYGVKIINGEIKKK